MIVKHEIQVDVAMTKEESERRKCTWYRSGRLTIFPTLQQFEDGKQRHLLLGYYWMAFTIYCSCVLLAQLSLLLILTRKC